MTSQRSPKIWLVTFFLFTLGMACGNKKRAPAEEALEVTPKRPSTATKLDDNKTKEKRKDQITGKPPAVPKAERMLLIVVDTLRADRLGAYGYDKPTTPTMDAIAKEGVRFTTLHAASPWTAPSFGSLYTGVSPTVHGAGAMLAKGSKKGHSMLGVTVGGIRKDLPTLAELMPEKMVTAGFATNAFLSESLGMGRGLNHYDHRNASVHRYRKADEVTDRALEWLEGNGDKPFFMMLHYIDPHMGYGPPDKYVQMFAPDKPRRISVPFTDHQSARDGSLNPNESEKAFIRGLYNGEVRFVDDQIKRVVEWMKQRQLLDDTWLVLTADHGEEQFDHGSFDHGHAYEDEVTRVPLIIRAPGGKWHANQRISHSIRQVDIPATLLHLLGEQIPAHFEGKSLLPMIEGKDNTDRPAYTEFNLRSGQQCALFDGRYKVVYDIRRKRGFFYDQKTDHGEMTKLGKENPIYKELLGNLMKKRAALQAAAKGKVFEKGALSGEAAEALKSLGYIE
jgi:arylsulfatase A-like enzyme